jgi:hypothetical protein
MERIASLLPIGPSDEQTHRGARRRSARYPIHADVTVVAPERAEGVVLNASAGGIRVALDRAFARGSEVTLEIAFRHDRVTGERAKVVWSRELPDGWLVGLAFVAA